MTDSAQATRTSRWRRAAVVLGVVAVCAVAVFFCIDGNIVVAKREAGPRAELPTAALDAPTRHAREPTPSRRPATRIDTSAPLPEPGVRLAPVYAELKARADAGDAAAASRLYRDLHRCLSATQTLHAAKLSAAEPEDIPETVGPELRAKVLAAMEQERANRAERLRKARQDSALCDGLDREQQFVLPAMRRAAELGDPDAAVCYVTGHDLWQQGALDHPEWMAEYKANALVVAENALERGNLGVAYMLAAAYSAEGFGVGPLEQVTGTDPAKSYRYRKLTSLAQPDPGASNSQLAAEALALSPQDRAAADAGAEDMFTRYSFRSRPHIFAVCEPDVSDEVSGQLSEPRPAAKN